MHLRLPDICLVHPYLALTMFSSLWCNCCCCYLHLSSYRKKEIVLHTNAIGKIILVPWINIASIFNWLTYVNIWCMLGGNHLVCLTPVAALHLHNSNIVLDTIFKETPLPEKAAVPYCQTICKSHPYYGCPMMYLHHKGHRSQGDAVIYMGRDITMTGLLLLMSLVSLIVKWYTMPFVWWAQVHINLHWYVIFQPCINL